MVQGNEQFSKRILPDGQEETVGDVIRARQNSREVVAGRMLIRGRTGEDAIKAQEAVNARLNRGNSNSQQ